MAHDWITDRPPGWKDAKGDGNACFAVRLTQEQPNEAS